MKLLEAINKLTRWQAIRNKQYTAYGYDGHLRQFCVFLKNKELEKIKIDEIIEWLDWQKTIGLTSSALAKKAIAIKNMLKFYKEQNFNVPSPNLVPIPQKEITMPRVANDEDYEILINSIPKSGAYYHIRNIAIINLLHDTGCRAGEITNLNVEDVDIKSKALNIRTEKDRSDCPFRKAFFTSKAAQALSKWLNKRIELMKETDIDDKKALFISVNGGVCGDGKIGRRMAENALAEMLRKYSRWSGLSYTINAHSFRHRIGRELAKRGANNSQISGILGHANIESSRIYTILNNFDLEKVYRKIIGE